MIGAIHTIPLAFVLDYAFAVVVIRKHSYLVLRIKAVSAAFKELVSGNGIHRTENGAGGYNLSPYTVFVLN
jgi:hypothetical protein